MTSGGPGERFFIRRVRTERDRADRSWSIPRPGGDTAHDMNSLSGSNRPSRRTHLAAA